MTSQAPPFYTKMPVLLWHCVNPAPPPPQHLSLSSSPTGSPSPPPATNASPPPPAHPDGPNEFRIAKGVFVLPHLPPGAPRSTAEVAVRVAVSYGLATSIKLDSLEAQIEETIKDTQAIPQVRPS